MIRYLSTIERAFLAMSEQLVMNPVVMVRCRGQLPVERIEHALRAVQAKQPALQVRLIRDEERPWFTDHQVGPIPLTVLDRRSDTHWQEVVSEELSVPIDAQRGPLMRVVLLRGRERCELICTTDHLNADGRSGLYALRDILRVIDEPELRLVPRRQRTSFDDYVAPVPGERLLLGPRLPEPWRRLWATRLRDYHEDRPGAGIEPYLRGLFGVELGGRRVTRRPKVEFVHRRLDGPRTQALIEACRGRETTVLTALVVACADALACADTEYAERKIGCVTPIDIRALLEPTIDDDFGVFAWAPSSRHSVGPGAEFWALAKRTHRILRAYRQPMALAAMRRLLDMGELYEGTPWAGFSGRVSRAMCDAMMVVSNLGRVSLPERAGGAEVESFGFFAMIPEVDFVLGVQSFRGVLELNFAYADPWSSRERTESIAARVEDTLGAAIGYPSGSRMRFG